MRKFTFIATITITLAAVAHLAHATIAPYWVAVPIEPDAIADDPLLATQQTWSLRVVVAEGFWHWGAMRVTLPAGEVFYNHPLGTQTRPSPAATALFPSLAHDTYVTSPREQLGGAAPHVRAGHPDMFEPPSLGGPTDLHPGIVSVNWIMFGPHAGPGAGDYEIARLTFPANAAPVVSTSGAARSVTESVSPVVLVPIPAIPEPTALAASIFILPLLARHPARIRPQNTTSPRTRRSLTIQRY